MAKRKSSAAKEPKSAQPKAGVNRAGVHQAGVNQAGVNQAGVNQAGMKLGRKAIRTDTRTLMLARYLKPGLPAPPPACDWT
ncbi:MAG: hypothetical protein WBF42_18980, partial [Terracidiphilus sp.]